MITIETIKIMMRNSTTFEEHEEIYKILKEKKSQINKAMWNITRTIAEKTADIPLDIDMMQQFIDSIDEEERQLLEQYANTQIQHRKVLNQVEGLMKETHMKMRGFLL